MSEHMGEHVSLEQAWENVVRLNLSDRFLGNIALVGYGEDTTTYQQVCILLARPEAGPDSFERNRHLVEGVDEKTGLKFVLTTPVASSDSPFKPFRTMLTYTDKVHRDLHVLSTGKRTVAIGLSLLPSAGHVFPEGFGRGDPGNYAPVSEDTTQTPVVSALLNIGWRKTRDDTGYEERVERSASYGLVTKPRHTEISERAFLNDIIPGTARAMHSYDFPRGEPEPFTDKPYLLPLFDKPSDTLDYYWEEVLPKEQRVAIAVLSVRGIKRDYYIRNAA